MGTGKQSEQSYVALLRGINVGGKNKLPMDTLRSLVEECGGRNVRSYIQSGNVVFTSSPAVASKMPNALQARIASDCSLNVPVVVRSRTEIAEVVKEGPFHSKAPEIKFVHVMFLADTPSSSQIETIDESRFPGDVFAVIGNRIHVWFPNGTARSKFTAAYIDRVLQTTSTMRNWNTVCAIANLL